MSSTCLNLTTRRRLPEPLATAADDELRSHVERALASHYELDCEIGRGGMGIVYRATDRRLKRQVAIKLLPPELAFRSEIKSRFKREAETAAGLSHPNIVTIYGTEDIESLVFFVMAYVNGDNLAKRLHERGVLGIDETRRILRDVADALAYAHGQGVVHRDIKPDNILLDLASGRPMVTDFGIARAMDSSGDSRLTATGMAIGTPAYMSPEQAAGDRQIDGRSDLYSLGVLGYQMLTGEPPFVAGSTPAMLVKHISERPVPVQQRRSDVPPDLARAVMMLLEKDPNNRFPTAAALVSALDSREVPPSRAVEAAPIALPPAYESADRNNYQSNAYQNADRGYAPPAYTPSAYTPPLYMQQDRASLAQPSTPYQPSMDELVRWDTPEVQKFRKKLAPYFFVNSVIVLFSIVGFNDFFFVTVLWSIYIAFKYAKLWSEGYDWKDVFKQPREKEVMEVAEEFGQNVQAIFDSKTRERLRAAREERKRVARLSPPSVGGAQFSPSHLSSPLPGPLGDRVRQAFADRDEIFRRLQSIEGSLPASQREEVSRSAIALAEKVQALAFASEELSRTDVTGARDQLEAEISKLEDAANPLERGSEDRVRRLAYLKRSRRGLMDADQRKQALTGKLETCAIALQNMRFDLMRLGASPQMHQHITGLANQAMSLADSVDDAVFVADEMGRLGNRPTPGGRRATE